MAIELKKGALQVLEQTGVIGKFASEVNHRLPRLISIEDLTQQFTSRFIDLTKQGMVPEIVVGHFTHLDPIAASDFCYLLIKLAQDAGIGENLKGFAVTLASSAPNGKQSQFIEGVYSQMEAYTNTRCVELVPVTREKDVERYGMSQSIGEKRPLVAKLRQRGMGSMILAGGSVEPGRHQKGASGDDIKGLQEITDMNILNLFDSMERSGRHLKQYPYFLPLSIDKTYRVFSSDSLLPTPEGVISFYDIPSKILGLVGFERVRIRMVPATPLTVEDMARSLGSDWRNHPKEATDFIMTVIARNLPPNARGYYDQFVKETP